MHQLDNKWSQCWQKNTVMCDTLQQQVVLLSQQQEATAQRLHQLQDQVSRATMYSGMLGRLSRPS